MVKNIKLNIALFFLVALVGCQSGGDEPEPEDIPVDQPSVVTLTIGTSSGSRTQTDEAGKVTWNKGDKVLVYGDNVEGVLTLQGEGGESVGTFRGSVKGNPNALKWSVYPAEGSKTTAKGAEINLSNVTYPYCNSPMVGEIGKDKRVDLNHLCSIVRIPVKNFPANTKMKISGKGIAGKAEWDGTKLTVTYSEESIEIEVPVSGDVSIDVPVFAQSTDTVAKTFTLTIDETSTKFEASVAVGKLNTNSNVVFECKVEDGKVASLTQKKQGGVNVGKEDDPMKEDDEEYLVEIK